MDRRQFSCVLAGAFAATATSCSSTAEPSSIETEEKKSDKKDTRFTFKYMLPSCMYGCSELDEILPEVRKIGATAIDIWPRVHGNQREQLAEMGEERFQQMLEQTNVALGCLTQYPLGPFGLKNEIELAGRLKCTTIVTGGAGPKGLSGDELRKAVSVFSEKMKPHLEHAAEHGVTIAIENHANNLIFSPDSLKWMVEFTEGRSLGVALAPYHLEQDASAIADLIRELGDRISIFYAWQHGHGCSKKLPKEEELLQMPGRGKLDFRPVVEALVEIRYRGWTEIFMHPVPRGIPILPTTPEVTAEINRARTYLDHLIDQA